MRNNFIALSYGFGYPESSSVKVDWYRIAEEDLALIRGFTRFFGGFLVAKDNGELSALNIKSGRLKGYDKKIFNAFIATKDNIYWTLDFMTEIRKTLGKSGTTKRWRGGSGVFKGMAIDKNYSKGEGDVARKAKDI